MSAATTAVRPVPSAARTPTGRGVELALVVVGVAVGALVYAQVGWVRDQALPPKFWLSTSIYLVLALMAHFAVRRFAPYADPVILPAVVLLNGVGLAFIYRLDQASKDRAVAQGAPVPRPDAPHQLLWTTIAVCLFIAVLVLVRDHRSLQRFSYTAMFAGLVLLLMPLMPIIGTTINGARIWVRLGSLSFQPSEIAKLLLIVFFASYLVVSRDALALARKQILGIDLPRGRDLGPILVAWLASLGVLVFERDLGTSLLFFGLFVAMLYVATERRSWIVIGALLFLAGSWFSYYAFGHVRIRVDIWLHPFAEASGHGYQIVQNLFALGTGGIIGTGIAQGHPELLLYPKSDSIVAALGEEIGLTGLMALLVLYAIIVERGIRTALRSNDSFGRLLAFGLAFVFGLQVFVVVGGVTRLIPLTGLTTPFLSAGGSSLVANWMLVALLLRVSDGAHRPAPPPPSADEAMTQVLQR